MPFKKNRSRFKFTLFLEYWWLKKELIRIYSYGTFMCMRCKNRDELEIHHLKGDGDVEREAYEIGTKTPHTMGYLYHMYWMYQYEPDKALTRYGVLCSKCNKLDRDARQIEKKLKKAGQTKLVNEKASDLVMTPNITKVKIFK